MAILIFAHETLSRIGTRHWIGSLRGRMLAEIFLLVLSKKGIGPVASLNVCDSLKKCRTTHIDIFHDCVVQVGSIELGHFDVGKGHVGVLKIASVECRIEKGGSYQVAALETGISNDALLKGNPLEVLFAEIRSIEVHSTCDGNRSAGLEGGGTSRRDLGVCGGRRSSPWGNSKRWFGEGKDRGQAHGGAYCSNLTEGSQGLCLFRRRSVEACGKRGRGLNRRKSIRTSGNSKKYGSGTD